MIHKLSPKQVAILRWLLVPVAVIAAFYLSDELTDLIKACIRYFVGDARSGKWGYVLGDLPVRSVVHNITLITLVAIIAPRYRFYASVAALVISDPTYWVTSWSDIFHFLLEADWNYPAFAGIIGNLSSALISIYTLGVATKAGWLFSNRRIPLVYSCIATLLYWIPILLLSPILGVKILLNDLLSDSKEALFWESVSTQFKLYSGLYATGIISLVFAGIYWKTLQKNKNRLIIYGLAFLLIIGNTIGLSGLLLNMAFKPWGYISSPASPWLSQFIQEPPTWFLPRQKKPPLFLMTSPFYESGQHSDKDGRRSAMVEADGEAFFTTHTHFGSKGGSYRRLTADSIRRLQTSLQQLPPSLLNPPPDERRLLLCVFVSGHPKVYGYDLANPPKEVLEILKLSDSGVRIWTPTFPADGKWTAHPGDASNLDILRKSNRLITCAKTLKIWDISSHELVGESDFTIPEDTHIALSPDEQLVAIAGGGYSYAADALTLREIPSLRIKGRLGDRTFGYRNPNFEPKSKTLFLESRGPIMGFYDVDTLKPAPTPEYFPGNIKKFESIGPDKFVTLTKDGALAVNTSDGKKVTIRSRGVSDFCSAISPSQEAIALAIGIGEENRRPDYVVSLIDAHTGAVTHELGAYHDDMVHSVFWSADSSYVLAAVRGNGYSFESSGILIWNAQTGLHRGTIERPHGDISGVALTSPNGGTLFRLSKSGEVEYWGFDALIQKIRDFEKSLESIK